MAEAAEIAVEVVYALPAEQVVVRLMLAPGSSAGDAIVQSGLLQRYVELNAAVLSLGIFGRRVTPDTLLYAGDRVEIYRPLTVDPKDARRRRVSLRAARKAGG